MATNPMQRKARQSFLLGAITTLLVCLVIMIFLFIQMNNMKEELNSETQLKNKVYVLKQDVQSGQELTADMFEQREVTKNAVPSDATSIATVEGTPIAKVDLKANTVLTVSMIEAKENKTTDDIREQTYNMISLPIDLDTGDYVDIRLMLPNGADFIVLSKTKVTIPDVGGVPIADTIKLNVSEEDILTLSSAIVEAYKIEGAKLYAIKYVEAGNQNAAAITYVPHDKVLDQIKTDPNIVQEARTALIQRYEAAVGKQGDKEITAETFRDNYLDPYSKAGDEEASKAGIQESAQATKEAREDYLSSLYGM